MLQLPTCSLDGRASFFLLFGVFAPADVATTTSHGGRPPTSFQIVIGPCREAEHNETSGAREIHFDFGEEQFLSICLAASTLTLWLFIGFLCCGTDASRSVAANTQTVATAGGTSAPSPHWRDVSQISDALSERLNLLES